MKQCLDPLRMRFNPNANAVPLQRKASNSAELNSIPPIVNNVLASSGQPLDTSTQGYMEERFGYDFSGVRVHSEPRAAESAEAVSAKAYTVGRNVVFGQGYYAPETREGKRVLAHELAHVVQQSRGGIKPPLDSSSSLEQAADVAAGSAVDSHAPIPVGGACGVGLALLSWNDVSKRIRPVAGLLAGNLGEKAVDGAITRAEAITGHDVPQPLEPLVNRGVQAISQLAPKSKQEATSQSKSSPAHESTGEEGLKKSAEKLIETSKSLPNAFRPVDPKEDTPELKQLFKERWRKAQVFHGIKLMYVAERTLTRAATNESIVKKSSRYWIVSHADKESGEVFYYAAFNRQANRNEFAIGPSQLDSFYENEKYFANIAETIYPEGGGELKGWEAKSGQAVDMAMEGDWGGAARTVIGSNVEAWQDPEFAISTATAFASGAAAAEAKAAPKPPSKFGRWFRNRSAGALSRVMVAAEDSLPVHTGGGGKIVNQSSMTAGEIRTPHVESHLSVSPSSETSSTVKGAVSTAKDISTDVSKSADLGKASTISANPTTQASVALEASSTVKGTVPTATDISNDVPNSAKVGKVAVNPITQASVVATVLGSPSAAVNSGSASPTTIQTPVGKGSVSISNLDARIAEAEADLNPARQKTLDYQASRLAEEKSLKGGPIKGVWNVKERIWILKRQKAFPDRTILEQPKIVGVKTADGKVKPTSDITGKGRTPDFIEIRGNKTVAGDLKSADELKNSIAGGIKKPGPIEADIRASSKVGGQHQVEADFLKEARSQGGKIIIEGKNVLTGKIETIEVDPANFASEVLTYDDVQPN